jgi:hypothetical protein
VITFAKLSSTIIGSSIWQEDNATRIVWITMLALKDRDGIVRAAIPGLANIANVSLDECKAALEKLLSPDEYSRTPDNEGRRIEVVQGGWRLLNHELYRDMESTEKRRADAARRKREERERDTRDMSHPVTPRHKTSRMSRHTDTDTDTNTDLEDLPLGPPSGGNASAKDTILTQCDSKELSNPDEANHGKGTETSTGANLARAKGTTGRPSKRGTQLPDNWAPKPEHQTLASSLGLHCNDQARAFADHALANGRTLKNWDAGFRSWLRKAKEFSRGSPSKSYGGNLLYDPGDRVRRLQEEEQR